mmetsp:Transcript_34441/g.60402  ORF Transcript_34441/g.60402 Transcript_34441/m.60402 type:complete len:606 (-) Transcript_34441:24-1841(-)
MEIDVPALKAALHPTHQEVREAVQALIHEDLFIPRYDISLAEDRELTRERLIRVASKQFLSPSDYKDDPCKIFAIHQCISLVDPALLCAYTIQYNLFVGSLINLSTERHTRLIPDVLSLKIVGSFALSEIGYGSNAINLKTTATYDPTTLTFDLHTPNKDACKFYVATYKPTHGVIFANLITKQGNQGIHAFFTPLRNEDGSLLPGFEELDLGDVSGPGGTGTYLFRFTHFKMPLESLMNRFSDLDADGTFTSKIPNKKARFIKTIERLVTGRICMSYSSIAGAEFAGLIAYRYALQRLAVGPTGKSDTPIMTYQLQQNALVPYFARLFVLELGANYAADLFRSGNSLVSTFACSLKALTGWTTNKFCRVTRERMGGAGYLAVNRIWAVYGSCDSVLTAEGDVGLLMIKTVNDLMKRAIKGKYVPPQVKLCPVRQIPHIQDFNTLDLLFELLKAREGLAFSSLAEKLTMSHKAGVSPFNVLSKTEAERVQHLGTSYGERVLAEKAIEAIGSNPAVAEILSLIAELYMLDCVKTDLNWFLLNNFLNLPAAKNIVRNWTSAIKRMTPSLGAITEAYGIPDSLIRAPAGGDYVGYNDKMLNGELRPKL